MIGNAEKIIRWLFNQDRDKRFEVKEYKEKRSLNANNYVWKLITEIANSLTPTQSKEEVYFKMLQDYGQQEMISMLATINPKGYFKYYKEVGRSVLNGKEFVHYKIFKGTSEYNTKEMSIFIDGVVQEAKQLGIETRTPEELQELKRLWNNE
jgi:hypothetical protein